jgi:hypothetical protein
MNERVRKLSEEIRELTLEEQPGVMDELPALTSRDPEPEVEEAWIAEAERRLDAYERGETHATPAEDVMERLGLRFAPKS